MTKRKPTDYTPDPSNANAGTERGLRALDDSLNKYGAGRSILVDKDGYVIAGNKTLERAVDLGFENVIEVETDGKTLVAVRRTDLSLLDDPAARELAYADNRVSQLDLSFNTEQLLADINAGVDLSALFYDWELEKLQLAPDNEADYAAQWAGMPAFEHEDLTAVQSLTIHFASIEAVQAFAKLIGQTITDKTKSIWYPKQEKIDYGEAHEP